MRPLQADPLGLGPDANDYRWERNGPTGTVDPNGMAPWFHKYGVSLGGDGKLDGGLKELFDFLKDACKNKPENICDKLRELGTAVVSSINKRSGPTYNDAGHLNRVLEEFALFAVIKALWKKYCGGGDWRGPEPKYDPPKQVPPNTQLNTYVVETLQAVGLTVEKVIPALGTSSLLNPQNWNWGWGVMFVGFILLVLGPPKVKVAGAAMILAGIYGIECPPAYAGTGGGQQSGSSGPGGGDGGPGGPFPYNGQRRIGRLENNRIP
jgi:hypothetical protein